MRQLFAPGADAILRLVFLILAVVVVGGLAVVYGVSQSDYFYGVGIAPAQPVQFSHKHHSGELGLDCRYCHTSVEVAATPGIPPTWTCMTCHSQIWTGSQMLAPVRESLANNRPLHWTRVNRLPEYVYYNHAIHVTKGIGCSSCHGPMDTMQLTYRANAFKMEFCITCHRNPEKFIRPAAEVWNMSWKPATDQAVLGKMLVMQNHIRSAAQLTDCSICHR